MSSQIAVSQKNASERVTNLLRERILSGLYEDGYALRQEKLAAELGCSRIPVREAIRQLEAEGLIVTLPRRGAMVAEMPADRIRESFELRAVLEPWLITAAIPRMDESDFTAAQAIINEMADLDLEGWADANWRFHRALYQKAAKAHALEILQRIHEGTERYVRVHMRLTSGHDKAQKDHSQILAHCRARDTQRAVSALTTHILDVSDKLIESVELARGLRRDETLLHPALRQGAKRAQGDT